MPFAAPEYLSCRIMVKCDRRVVCVHCTVYTAHDNVFPMNSWIWARVSMVPRITFLCEWTVNINWLVYMETRSTCGTVKSWQSISTKTKAHLILSMTLTPYPPTYVWQCAMSCHRIWLNYNAQRSHSLFISWPMPTNDIYIHKWLCYMHDMVWHGIEWKCDFVAPATRQKATLLCMCQKCTSIASVHTEHRHRITKAQPNC